jgi:HPt (histidine-containing phosphotransfer) domain-containing protein
MDGYLTKPLDPQALCAELSRRLTLPADESRAPPAPAAMPALPGFDAANLRRWLDASPDAWYAMARAFATDYPAMADAIGAALDAGDRARAGHLLHRLRGSAGALGALELGAAAERLERALERAGPVDTDLRIRFFASAEAALAVLAGLTAEAPDTTSAIEDAEPESGERDRRLGELSAQLAAGNTRALDHVVWLQRWVRSGAPGEAATLLRQIEALDFPAALKTVRLLGEGVLTGPR